MSSVTQDTILSIIFRKRCRDVTCYKKIVMFLGKMSLRYGTCLSLVISMNPFLEPVGDERPYIPYVIP